MTPNSAQKQAIESIVGPVLVLAGPGTGKTFTLTERILYLLKQGVDANRILALTFTENASIEMRERLGVRLDLAVRHVPIFTFHGFCQHLIQSHPERFEVSDGVRALDDVTRFQMIREALVRHSPQFLKAERGDLFYYVREIVSKISLVKREAIRAQPFHAELNVKEAQAKEWKETARTQTKLKRIESQLKMVGRLREFWIIYEEYQRQLYERNLTDYEDMILRVGDVFREQPDFLDDIRERYDYIHVDEFQDNNSAQNEILYELAGEDPNLFVVGDDDQSIFRFQGACVENIREFIHRYPKTTVVSLTENHRSTPQILRFSHAFISYGRRRLEKEMKGELKISKLLTSSNPHYQKLKDPVQFIACVDRWNESEWISKEILLLKEKDSSLKWSDFAILSRTNREANELGLFLKRHEIPFRMGDSEDALATPAIQNLLGILRAISKPDDEIALCHALMFPPFGISYSDVCLLNQVSRSRRISLWNLLEGDLQSFALSCSEKILFFRNQLLAWRRLFRERSLIHAFLDVLHQSKLFEFHLHPTDGVKNGTLDQINNDSLQKIDPTSLRAFRSFTRFVHDFSSLHPDSSLQELLHHIEIAQIYGVCVDLNQVDLFLDDDRVHLLTAHKSKGMEFRIVFVVNTTATAWEKRRRPGNRIDIPSQLIFQRENSSEATEVKKEKGKLNVSEDDLIEEERRLLYVAATRARERLYLTRPMMDDKRNLEESLLLAPLKEKDGVAVWEEIPATDRVENICLQLAPQEQGKALQAFLKERVSKMPLSPTALHRYERCPRQFLYSHVYLIPTKLDRSLVYGNAVHETLRRFFNLVRKNKTWPSFETLIQNLLETLKTQPLETAKDYADLEVQAKQDFTRFYAWCVQRNLPSVVETEVSIQGIAIPSSEHLSDSRSNILLSGKFDRIDLQTDGSWMVVDYKTGRPRTENEFFGKTKNSAGEYWDQFRFYKLLNRLGGHSGSVRPITRGMVVYIQDPESSYEFDLGDQDAAEIQEKIQKISERIRSLNFEPISENQSDEVCRRCAYIGLCRAHV